MPKYIGLGTYEDSLASCKSLVPREPRKDIVRYIVNANKYLRFGCVLDSARPEDQNRQFILKYSLADGKISVHEFSITNSGISGGKFLSPQLVARNDRYSSEPDYYTCKDLYIGNCLFFDEFKRSQKSPNFNSTKNIIWFFLGAILIISCRRFIITSADLNDYRYMKENPELFSKEAIESVRDYLISTNCLSSHAEVQFVSFKCCVDCLQLF